MIEMLQSCESIFEFLRLKAFLTLVLAHLREVVLDSEALPVSAATDVVLVVCLR